VCACSWGTGLSENRATEKQVPQYYFHHKLMSNAINLMPESHPRALFGLREARPSPRASVELREMGRWYLLTRR
jgi:hypothetical protein